MTVRRIRKRESLEEQRKFRSSVSLNPVECAGSRLLFMVFEHHRRANTLSHYKKKIAPLSIGQRLALSLFLCGVAQ